MSDTPHTLASTENAPFPAVSIVPLGHAPDTDVPGAGWLAVTGEDRVRWLNGMVTNSAQALTPGEGAYTFLLSAQGRIQGDATIWAEPDRLLLQTSSAQAAPMQALLDRFIIMDDVELADLTGTLFGLAVAGRGAPELLQQVGLPQARTSRLLKRQAVEWHGQPYSLVTAYSPLLPRFELWSATQEAIDVVREALLQAGATAGTVEDLELLRIAEGLPRFGVDIRERELPQETGQARALHFNKGCYLGQEIVERIRSRGNVHRTFTQFVLSGSPATPGTALLSEGRQVGELTSVASAPVGGEHLALGFVRREALERGLRMEYQGGVAEPRTPAVAS